MPATYTLDLRDGTTGLEGAVNTSSVDQAIDVIEERGMPSLLSIGGPLGIVFLRALRERVSKPPRRWTVNSFKCHALIDGFMTEWWLDYEREARLMRGHGAHLFGHKIDATTTRRILFLDIDGVLNSSLGADQGKVMYDWHGRRSRIEPELVARLRTLLDSTGASVVWSTSWRRHCNELPTLLEDLGIAAPILGLTPLFDFDGHEMKPETRAKEISAWLEALAQTGRRPQSLVMLDDMPVAPPHQVLVDPVIGLTDHDVEEARALLEMPFVRDPSWPTD